MRLFKIILVFFAIYFIRRFIQFYRVVEKRGRELRAEEETPKKETPSPDNKVVDAEYKVIDR
jgi:hypothetical protein